MKKVELEVYDVLDEGDKKPPEGEVKLVLAFTSPLPGARPFYCFASYKDGKWTEANASQTDLTEVVAFWFEIPPMREFA
jgi:hypothetical protein